MTGGGNQEKEGKEFTSPPMANLMEEEEEEERIDVDSIRSSQAQDGPETEVVTSPQPMSPLVLLSGERYLYLTVCIPLYGAAMKGDWKTAEGIFKMFPPAVRMTITQGRDTTLHIAAAAKHVQFVEEMVKMMEPKDLELQNKYSNTALCFAAASGIVRIAEVMVKKNENLPMIQGGGGMIPLHMAALLGHSEMVRYLYNKTVHEHLAPGDWVGLLNTCISTDLYDVALDILHHHPALAVERDENDETALHLLARKPSAFSGGDQLHMWNTFINSSKLFSLSLLRFEVRQRQPSEISDLIRRPSPLLLVAAELGNTVFLTELVGSYPDLIWEADNDNRTIFHIAVLHRRESIFNLIYEIGSMKDLIVPYKDDNDNNMVAFGWTERHPYLNAILRWRRSCCLHTEKGKTKMVKHPGICSPRSHKNLMKDGEKWMRGTAAQSMLVATLIATVVFAAAFTVPGGSNQDTGIPILLRKKSFMIFAVSDAIALFSSSTSILVFLSILTSRYAEDDFLESLPSRLMFGLITLFVSIISMMIYFALHMALGFSFDPVSVCSTSEVQILQ
ncbi:hypothetical protein CK203_101049 [Vitis vinifera]|uniref:PGG domain-containing protein n=1 Tax=Vitis vinifera TaxID=29760 RepID=A0A438FI57_VITVI|nr:hypothetical protein CK203_101049 [Vitis vinifera]